MTQKVVGKLIVALGLLALSLELYGLKLVYLFEKLAGFPWRPTPLSYFGEPNILLCLLITVSLIIWGTYLIFKKPDNQG